MFTGIVEALGTVSRLEARPTGRRIEVEAPAFEGGVALGDSISVNGCCLTVTAIEGARFAMDVVPETLQRTTLGELNPNSSVNLERAMPLGGRVGGHLVQGHVDGVGTVQLFALEGGGRRVGFVIPEALRPFVAEKGSITVDGVSLTVARVTDVGCEVALIPYTLQHTVARAYHRGTRVNLEVDLIARYVARLLEAGSPERSAW